jgi:hypothetical protein
MRQLEAGRVAAERTACALLDTALAAATAALRSPGGAAKLPTSARSELVDV